VLLTAAGLALLAITGDTSSGQDSANYSEAAMLIFEAVLTAVGVALILSCRRNRREEHTGIVLGVAAGLLFTFTHVAVKALTGKIDTTVAEVFLSPYLWVAVLGGVAAFFASARSLQLGPAVPVIAVTAIAGNASAIPAGIVVFGDPVGSHALHIGVRMFAFLLVIAAAALIPAPVRAVELGDGAAEEPEADRGDDRGDHRDAPAEHTDEREHEAHDRHRARRAPREHELVGAALPAPARGRSA
jgi:hypothetical protein